MEHISVFNSTKNSKTIVGKLVSSIVEGEPKINDLIDDNGKIVFIETEEELAKYKSLPVLNLEVQNKEKAIIVAYNLISNSFKKAVAEEKVKINSLVVIIIKKDTSKLLINNDGFAVIKHYIPTKSFRETKATDVRFDEDEWKAVKRFQTGERWKVTTFADEDSISAGYGNLDDNGIWQYPLPVVYIKQIYGTLSWSEWIKKQNIAQANA